MKKLIWCCVLATIVAGLLLSPVPCDAKAQPTRLRIYNNTATSLATTVRVKNNSDWENNNRPDNNFNPRTINPLSGSVQPEDLNSNSKSASFDMTVTFQNGDVVSLTTDQKDAWKLSAYEARKLVLGGPQSANYAASWVTLADETLAISFSVRQDPATWMSQVPDNLLLSQLTIPGTHDSASLFENATSLGFAKTQDLNLADQLNLGVRFFDIRLNKNLDVYHGPVFQHLTFSQVMSTCADFLRTNPSETILMLINASDPGTNNKNPDAFARAVSNAMNGAGGVWSLGNKIPTLGDVRGTIQLLRRYPAGSTTPLGIDVTDWPDDTRYDLKRNSDGVSYAIQDHWKCCATAAGKTDKRNEIQTLFDNAVLTARVKPALLFFNFTSANRVPLLNPRGNAQYFNPFSLALLVQTPLRARGGIFAMDFIEWEQTGISPGLNDQQALIQQIISYNLGANGSEGSVEPGPN